MAHEERIGPCAASGIMHSHNWLRVCAKRSPAKGMKSQVPKLKITTRRKFELAAACSHRKRQRNLCQYLNYELNPCGALAAVTPLRHLEQVLTHEEIVDCLINESCRQPSSHDHAAGEISAGSKWVQRPGIHKHCHMCPILR